MSIGGLLSGGRSEPDRKISGILLGVVTDIDDPEKNGRVKVKLLDRDTSDYETDFIPVLASDAGNKSGFYVLPEVGDLAAVAFLDGEIERPIVIGRLWNQNRPQPYQMENGENKLRAFRTKNGNQVVFYDEDDRNAVEILTPEGLTILLDDKEEMIRISDKKKKNRLVIDIKNGIAEAEAESKISLTAGGSRLELDGDGGTAMLESRQSLTIKSQQIVIEANGTLEMKSSGSMNLKANGPADIKGAVVKLG